MESGVHMEKRYRTLLSLVLLGFVSWWLYLDRLNFIGELRYAGTKLWITVIVVLLTYATDNLEWRSNSLRLATNVVGVAAGAFIIGWRFAALLPGVVFLRKGSYTLMDRLRIFANYVFTYYCAGIVTDWLPSEMSLLSVFLYLMVARAANWLLVDQIGHGKSLSQLFMAENVLSLLLVPSYYVVTIAQTDSHRVFFLSLPLITLLAVREFLKVREMAHQEIRSRKRLENINRDLEKILDMMKLIRSSQDPEKVFHNLARLIAQTFGYRYALLNLFNQVEDRVERVASWGINEEDFKRLKENAPTVTEVRALMDPKYRVSKSYFIPEGAEPLDEGEVFFGFYEESSEENAWRPADVFLVPISDSSGETIGYISLDSPVGGRRPRIEEIRMIEVAAEIAGRIFEDSMEYIQAFQRAQRDSLTGLFNHSAFYSHLEKAVKADTPLSVAMIDVDDFKKINDTYGHLVGDEILRRLSGLFRESLRESDVIARYGGDEFAVILAGVVPKKALEILDRIRVKVEKTDFLGIKVSVSIGISGYPQDGTDPEMLVEKADIAMYRAKSLGKNKTVVYEGGEENGAHQENRGDAIDREEIEM